jgi:hypothetical protein
MSTDPEGFRIYEPYSRSDLFGLLKMETTSCYPGLELALPLTPSREPLRNDNVY